MVPRGIPRGSIRTGQARPYDFFLGGTHNFAADRELARKLLEAELNARYIAAENRAFLGRDRPPVAWRGGWPDGPTG